MAKVNSLTLKLCYIYIVQFFARICNMDFLFSAQFTKLTSKNLNTLQNKAVKIIGGGRYSNRAMHFYSKFCLKTPYLCSN